MVLNLSCTLTAGGFHTVGIEPDGTVVATGRNDDEQCDVSTWMDITQVAAGYQHTVGLQSGGTVVATGRNDEVQCNVDSWTDIVQVAAGGFHTVGLHSDGTVVAEGKNDEGQCNVGDWTDIGLVVAGYAHTVGIRNDYSVVATGRNDEGQCNVGSWRDIVWVGAGGWHTVGLKDNGRVFATGDNNYGQCDVDDWILYVPGNGEPLDIYYLTISSTANGLVTAPGEGTFTKVEGTVVDLVAEAEEGYQFANWTGDVDDIANIEDATTTITMNDDCVITANFEEFPGVCGCFIATAAYGTPMAEEIEILCDFRDEYLLTNPMGQALVALYYSVSPPMAEFITEHPSLKPIVRAGLLPAVAMSAVAVNATTAEKTAILGLLVLVLVVLAVWATRRRGRGPLYT